MQAAQVDRRSLVLRAAKSFFILTCVAWSTYWILARGGRNNVWDDSFMFWRVANNVMNGHGLAWNPGGHASYGLTSPAYMLPVLFMRAMMPSQPALGLALVSSTFGVLLLVLVHRQLRKQHWRAWQEALALALAMPTLSHHFFSGMETTFALCIAVTYLGRDDWSARGEALWTGALWFVRPEMIVFPLARAVFVKERSWRERARRTIAAGAVLACALLFAWYALGSPVPFAALAKRAGFYGESFTDAYRQRAYVGAVFAIAQAAPLLSGAMSVSWSTALGSCAIALYHTFIGLPIMGYDARFHWPWMAATATNSVRAPRRAFGRWILASSLIASVAFAAWSMSNEEAISWRTLGHFDLQRETQARARYWVGIFELAALDGNVTIATTEVGAPGVLMPNTRILDLAGLNEPRLTRDRVSPAALILSERPDWIYLPHPLYADMNRELARDPAILAAYDVHPAESLDAKMGVAVRKDSPHFGELMRILRDAAPAPSDPIATSRNTNGTTAL